VEDIMRDSWFKGLKLNHKKRTKKEIITKAVLIIISIFLYGTTLYYANHDKPGYYTTIDSGMEYETARVIEVIEDNTVIDETTENVRRGNMVLNLEILTGRYRGDIVETTNYFSSLYNVYVTKGDKVSVRIDTTDESSYNVSVYNYNRKGLIIGLVVLFLAVILIVGRIVGLRAIAGLIFTLVNIVFLLLPLVLKGFSPIPTTIVILTVTTIVCFVLLGGIQPKTISAALGTISGVVIAALIAFVVGEIGHITGFHTEEAESLLIIATDTKLTITGLFISSVLIAALGAVMDIAMSISSAIEELHINSPSMKQKELFRSGMNIGRDSMGTMANTLILALAGSSMNMMLLMYSYGVTFNQMINTDFVAVEVVRSIAGSLGIVFAVPITSLIGSIIISNRKK